jgi:hypothetical protein
MERTLYRLENMFILITALYIFLIYGTTWTGFLLFLMAPKIMYLFPDSWLRYKGYVRFHQIMISLLHSYSVVILVVLFAFLFMNTVLWSILGWVVHIAVDRVVKYKIKTMTHPLFH